MAYVPKTDWRFNDVLSEKDMNRIEGGIAEGKQLVEVHAADKNNPHSVTAAQIGAETPEGAQAKVELHVKAATGAHKASAIAVEDMGNLFTSGNVEGALNELFTSVDDGKAKVKNAIVAKGGAVGGTAPHSFQEIVDGIAGIQVGDYRKGDTVSVLQVIGQPLILTKTFSCPGYLGFYVVGQDSFRGSDSSNLYAFTSSGTIWSLASSTKLSTTFSTGDSYQIHNGYVYHVSSTGVRTQLGAREALSGAGADLSFYCDGVSAYFGTEGGYIWKYAITYSSGSPVMTKVWRVQPSVAPVSSLAVDTKGDVFATFSGDVNYVRPPYLRKLSGTTGGTLFSINQGSSNSFGGSAYVYLSKTGHLYLTTTLGNKFKRYDPITGEVIWETTVLPTTILGSDSLGNLYCYFRIKNPQTLEKIDPDGNVLWSSADIRGTNFLSQPNNEAIKNAVAGTNLFIPRNDSGTSSGTVVKAVQEIILQ